MHPRKDSSVSPVLPDLSDSYDEMPSALTWAAWLIDLLRLGLDASKWRQLLLSITSTVLGTIKARG